MLATEVDSIMEIHYSNVFPESLHYKYVFIEQALSGLTLFIFDALFLWKLR